MKIVLQESLYAKQHKSPNGPSGMISICSSQQASDDALKDFTTCPAPMTSLCHRMVKLKISSVRLTYREVRSRHSVSHIPLVELTSNTSGTKVPLGRVIRAPASNLGGIVPKKVTLHALEISKQQVSLNGPWRTSISTRVFGHSLGDADGRGDEDAEADGLGVSDACGELDTEGAGVLDAEAAGVADSEGLDVSVTWGLLEAVGRGDGVIDGHAS